MLQGLMDEMKVITARQDAHRAGMQADTKRLKMEGGPAVSRKMQTGNGNLLYP